MNCQLVYIQFSSNGLVLTGYCCEHAQLVLSLAIQPWLYYEKVPIGIVGRLAF